MKPGQIDPLGIELELAGFDLREVQYLVDEAKEVGAGGIHTAAAPAPATGHKPDTDFILVALAH